MNTLDLLTDARRLSNSLGNGEAYAADEAANDLRYLNRLLRSLLIRPLVAKSISANTAGQSGYAYQCDTAAGTFTLTLPSNAREAMMFSVADLGSFSSHHLTIQGNGYLISGATSQSIDTGATWFFRADTGNWEKVRDLTLTDDVYLPDEACGQVIVVLASLLAQAYGSTFDAKLSAASELNFRNRYGRRGGAK